MAENAAAEIELQLLKTTALEGISLLCMLMTPNKESGRTFSPKERDGIAMLFQILPLVDIRVKMLHSDLFEDYCFFLYLYIKTAQIT